MATEQIEHFLDGLNLLAHPTKLKNTELQTLENMEVRPTSVSDTLTYLALTSRSSYKRLHTDNLDFIAKNLIEFVQRVVGGAGINSKYLVTGGYYNSNFVMKALLDGGTTLTAVSSTASSDTGIASFLLFNQFLYYTDGNIAWRSWDGVTDAASGFTTVTKYGIKHKSRAFYGNDVTNAAPHYLWVSDVGLPGTVNASNFFQIGDKSDPIIGLEDQIERVIIFKERSTWAFYLAPTLSNSTLLRADEFKGTIASLGHLWANGETYVYTTDAGIQKIKGLQYSPTVPQLWNFAKGFQNSLAALGFREDQLLISTLSTSSGTRNNRVFAYDLITDKLYQHNISMSCFCSNRGVSTFGKRAKAVEDDGTNRRIVEFDLIASTVEATVTCKARTKDFTFGGLEHRANLDGFAVEFSAPAITTVLTLKVYADGTLVETKTFAPTATGIQRHYFDLMLSLTSGYYHSFQLEYVQDATLAAKFALHSAIVSYTVEERAE
jgi:hypothetical protein